MDQRALPTRAYLLWIFSFAILSGSSLGVAKAWSNPSLSAPSGEPGPIVITLGGTQSSNVSQDRSDLGTAASGANSDITSIDPYGNMLDFNSNGDIGINTAGPASKLDINGDIKVGAGTYDGDFGVINFPSSDNDNAFLYAYDTQDGAPSNTYDLRLYLQDDQDDSEKFSIWGGSCSNGGCTQGVGGIQQFYVTAAGNEWLRGNLTVNGVTFPDGTIQTTAYVNPANGSQTWAAPGTYTWTVPSGVTRIFVEEWGAGGGGGAGGYSGGAVPGGTGGGGGAYTYGWMDVTPKSNVTVVVGVGGTGWLPWAGSGTGGGSSSVGSTIVANGGGAGENENLGAPGGGSAQTTGYYSNYAILVAFAGGGYNNATKSNGGGAGAGSAGGGGNGGSGSYYFVSVGAGAPGYGALAGGATGGDGTSGENANGSNGAAPGAGGGGGGTVTSGTQPITGGVGGTGGAGEVIIRW